MIGTVILLILKIILYILLGLIGLLILLLSIILFVPIRYTAYVEKYDELKVDVKATWLLKIVRLKYFYDKQSSYSLKVFWKSVFSSDAIDDVKSKQVLNNDEIIKAKTDTQINKSYNSNKDIEEKKADIKTTIPKDSSLVKENINKPKDINKFKDVNKPINQENKITSKSKLHKKTSNEKKQKTDKQKLKKKESKIKKIIKDIIAFLKNDEYDGVIKFVFIELYHILKALLPSRVRLNMKIGTGDPATTGYILGMISILYAVSGNSMKVVPDFDEKSFEGYIYLKGRIFIFIIVYYVVKILLDKRVKKIIAEYNN